MTTAVLLALVLSSTLAPMQHEETASRPAMANPPTTPAPRNVVIAQKKPATSASTDDPSPGVDDDATHDYASENVASDDENATKTTPDDDTAAWTGERTRVIVPEFRAVGVDVSKSDVEAISGVAVYQLSQVPGLRVLSGADLREMLDHEASKQVMGCTENSCLSELADALGAPLLVAGEVTRLGPRIRVMLSLIHTAAAEVVGRAAAEGRDLGEVAKDLRRAVHELTPDYGGVPGYENVDERKPVMRFIAERANDPDVPLLLAFVAAGVLTPLFPPLVFALPIMQAVIMWWIGDDFTGRDYPYWWVAIPVGYLALLGGVIVAGIAGAMVSTLPLGSPEWSSASATFATTGVVFATIFLLEPAVAWLAASIAARDIDRTRSADDAPGEVDGNDDDDDETTSENGDETNDDDAVDDEAEDAAAHPESLLSTLLHLPSVPVFVGAPTR